MRKRACGVLLPVSSLPSKYGIGCFSQSAYEFVDQLARAKQSYWQILPLGPTSYGDSPYQSFSTFAGNPYMISLEDLIEEGVLTEEECDQADFGEDPSRVDYGKIYENRFVLLRRAYERSRIYENEEFREFCRNEGWWLADYALFMAVKERFGGKSWIEWAQDIRLRWGNALDYYRKELYFDIEFYEYLQFVFFRQWTKLKQYANEKGIRIIGDIPIYVAFDSADTWANPGLFQLDGDNLPVAVAGCPPDAFSATGQLWGNPLYRWDYHRQQGYDWWIRRLEKSFSLYDVVRIDHFRGFDEYYSIPYKAETAMEGHWEKGPGMELFRAVHDRLGPRAIIAEDLGLMTDSVRQLVKDSGYPNMRVLEFAFEEDDPEHECQYLPHQYDPNCVVYTGTHDNDTLVSWYAGQSDEIKNIIRDYLPLPAEEEKMPEVLLWMAVSSTANLSIIPMQDYLGLGGEARINLPSTLGTNWQWRLLPGQVTEDVLEKMYRLNLKYGRCDLREEEKKALEKARAERKAAAERKAKISETLEETEEPDETGEAEEVKEE